MPNGMVEVTQISRAEQMANRVGETHSTLMLLFTILSHTLLPEVSNYLEQLNEIARDLNVPTTLSRLREAANSAVVAAVTRAEATGATGAAGGGGIIGQMGASSSPTSSLITMRSRSGSAASSTDGSGGGGGGSASAAGPTGRPNLAAGVGGPLNRTTLLIGQLPLSPGGRDEPEPGLGAQRNRSESSSAPTLRRVMGTIGSSTSRRRRRSSQRSQSRSPSPPPRQQREEIRASQAAATNQARQSRATSRTPPPSPTTGPSTTAGTSTATGAQQARQQSTAGPARPGTPIPRAPTPDEVRRALEQRQRDIKHLTESFNKVNQVYEVLMIMHMVVHRNQVELEAPQGENQNSSSDSSD